MSDSRAAAPPDRRDFLLKLGTGAGVAALTAQTAETAWNVWPWRNTNNRSSARNLMPSGKSVGGPSFTVVGES